MTAIEIALAGYLAFGQLTGNSYGKKGQTLLYKLYCICLTVGCGMW